MAQIKHKERSKAALKVIKSHFSGSETDVSINDKADLLAFHSSAWGTLEPILSFKQKKTLIKASQELKILDKNVETSAWLSFEVRKIYKKLDELAQSQTLHGKQNTSDFRSKLALIDGCRDVWEGYTGKVPPISFQGETHKFTLFVADVIQEVFDYDFSPRSAIEAYKKQK
tara:strand:- start:405 stop:917 length:513 start_codon:yes stop_codon:yes gene_type:complete